VLRRALSSTAPLISALTPRGAQAAALHADLCAGGGPLDAELFTSLVLAGSTRPAQAAPAEFDAAFALFDADGDGAVSSVDLDDVLRRVRAKPAHLRAHSCLTEPSRRLSRADFAALLAHGPPRRAAARHEARA
jgi:Ca2+-binding EF-hand superfamily protein